jgi:thioester reductase-like protein
LLTGGTGFLGVYVLKDLLSRTTAKISCLVRGETDEIAEMRLLDTLTSYFPDLVFDRWRIQGIKGDITQAHLGLSSAASDSLRSIDTVYHLAANVSHFGKIEVIDRINFEGTVNLLEWSKRSGVRCFNHFSTDAIASGGYIAGIEQVDFYETDLNLGQKFGRQIYPESKFKAEQYIKDNKDRLKVNIFRIGNIGGDSHTGLFQKNIGQNAFYQRLKTLAGMRYYCDEVMSHAFATTPVDIVSEIVTQLSLRENDVLNTFHIVESDPILLGQMVIALEKNNIMLQKTDIDSFSRHVDKLSYDSDLSIENSILGIMRYGDDTPYTRFVINQQATQAYLAKIGVQPRYDRVQYANTIIKYCIQKGFIKQSSGAAAISQ